MFFQLRAAYLNHVSPVHAACVEVRALPVRAALSLCHRVLLSEGNEIRCGGRGGGAAGVSGSVCSGGGDCACFYHTS